MIELQTRGLKAEQQIPVKVDYKGSVVGDYVADIIVEKSVIVELKTVEKLTGLHEAQLLNYLKATGMKIGLLVNFQDTKAEIKRLVLDLSKSGEVNN